jgi:ribonuclease P protein subunit POP4
MTSTPTPKSHIAHTLLSRAHSPDSATQQFTERIKQKPLFLRATSPTASDNRSRRRLHRLRKKEYFIRHQKPRPLSARQKRDSGLYDLPKEECKYAIFKGLHELWVGYMQEILDVKGGPHGHISPASHGSKLVSADYHGAEVEVVRSRCAGRVGVKGIVVRDTKFTFVVVTERDEVKSEFWCLV